MHDGTTPKLIVVADQIWLNGTVWWTSATNAEENTATLICILEEKPQQTVPQDLPETAGLTWDNTFGWTDGSHPEAARDEIIAAYRALYW